MSDSLYNPLGAMEDFFLAGKIATGPQSFMTLKSGAYVRFEDSFTGPVAQVGDRVEMICTERTEHQMLFQLRTIPSSEK